MAKEEKKKKELKGITHHKAEGGGFVHEHHYKGEKGEPDHSTFGGFSPTLADLHQHVDDHLGDAPEQAQEPEGDEGGGAAPGGAPGGAAPGGGAPPAAGE